MPPPPKTKPDFKQPDPTDPTDPKVDLQWYLPEEEKQKWNQKQEEQPVEEPVQQPQYMPHPGLYSNTWTPGYEDLGEDSTGLKGYPAEYNLINEPEPFPAAPGILKYSPYYMATKAAYEYLNKPVIEDWNYQNPPVDPNTERPVNQFAEPLPYGAEAWDANGIPYYGQGVRGFLQKMWSRMTSPYFSPDDPYVPLWKYKEFAVAKNKYEEETNFIEQAEVPSAMLKSVFGGLFDVAQQAAIQTEQALGVLLPETEMWSDPTVLPWYSQSPSTRIFAPMWADNAPQMVGFALSTRNKDIEDRPEDIGEVGEYIERKWHSGRILYSGIVDSLVRTEFERRQLAGEDPNLLKTELEIPGAEFVGQLLMDPLNLIGVGPAKNAKYNNRIDDALYWMTEPSPLLEDVFKTLTDAPSLTREFNKLDELAQAQIATTYRFRSGEVLNWLDEFSSKHGIFHPLARGKRAFIDELSREVVGNLMSNSRSIDEFGDVINAMWRLGSEDADEIVDAMTVLANHKTPSIGVSRAGQMFSATLREIVGDDIAKFGEQMSKAKDGGMDTLLEFVTKRISGAEKSMFPSVTERIAAQKIVNAADSKGVEWVLENMGKTEEVIEDARGLIQNLSPIKPWEIVIDKWHNRAQKVYGVAMNVFSSIYMGVSSPYAFKNAWNNYLTAFVDEGIGAISPTLYGGINDEQQIIEMLGRLPSGARGITTLGPLGEGIQEGGRLADAMVKVPDWVPKLGGKEMPLMYGTALAEYFEKQTAVKIIKVAARETLDKMVQPGKALPPTDDLIRAGLDRGAAHLLNRFVIENNFNVDKSVDQVVKMVAEGKVDLFKTLAWLPRDQYGDLVKFDLKPAVLDAIRTGETQGEVLAKLDEIIADVGKFADSVNNEIPAVPTEGRAVRMMAEAVDAKPAIKGIFADSIQANEWANKAYYEITDTLIFKTLDALPQNPDLISLYKKLTKYQGGGDAKIGSYGVYRWMRNKVLEMKKKKYVVADIPQAWKDLVTSRPPIPDELIGTPLGEMIVERLDILEESALKIKPTTPTAFKEALWGDYWFPGKGIFDDYTDYHAGLIEGLFDLYNRSVPEGMKIEQNVVNQARKQLAKAKAWQVEPIRIKLAQVYETAIQRGDIPSAIATRAKAFGIPTATEEGVNLNKKLLNIINKYKPNELDEFDSLANVPMAVVDNIFKTYAETHLDEIDKLAPEFVRAPRRTYHGGPPTKARIFAESEDGILGLLNSVKAGINDNWGKTSPAFAGSQGELAKALKGWKELANIQVGEAKAAAGAVGNAARDFALHDYRKRQGFDLALSYVFPYHFWYTRTYKNWMTRIAYSPESIAAYAKYKTLLSKIHSDMPEWWRYNINTNDLPGIETDNPIYFNLESTLNPLYALVGVDFNDNQKRHDFFSSFMDTMDNFGPSPWTPFSIGSAMVAYAKGEEEAAKRLAGRFMPQTKQLRDLLTIANVNIPTGRGYNEFDPSVLLFSKGLDPYDERMVSRSLGTIGEYGKYTKEEMIDAARNKEGPIWDEAVRYMLNYRATGNKKGMMKTTPWLLSFVGVGWKPRTKEDKKVDEFDTAKIRLLRMKDMLSPDEYRESWDRLYKEYPFGDVVSIARGTKDQRDESYIYNVLSRVPPGQRDDLFDLFGLDYEMVRDFMDTKGDVLAKGFTYETGEFVPPWNSVDREAFMSGTNRMGAILSLPDAATKRKWKSATNSYKDMIESMEDRFGDNVMERITQFFSIDDPDERSDYIDNNPLVSEALDYREDWIQNNPEMMPYYSSLEKIQRYYNNQVYEAIRDELGDEVFDEWDQYFDEKLSSQLEVIEWRDTHQGIDEAEALRNRWYELGDAADVKKDVFWDVHKPRLERYRVIREEWYANTIDPSLADMYGISVDEIINLRNEYKQAFVDGYMGQPDALVDFFEANPMYPDMMNQEQAYRNMMYDAIREELGEDIFDLWKAYGYNTELAEMEQKALGDLMDEKGYWGLLNDFKAFKEASQEKHRSMIGENSQLEQYREIKERESKKAAKDIVSVYNALKPIAWGDVREGGLPSSTQPIKEFMSQTPGSEPFKYEWDDWKGMLSPTMQRVVLDYALRDEDMPDVAMSQIEYIAEQQGIDPYLVLELMKQSLYQK